MVIKKLLFKDKQFPLLLKEIPDPPKELYVLGEPLTELTSKPCLAVVGSRKVTGYGRTVTANLVRELAGHGLVIVSGLAFGVDSIAHQAALEVGGQTIAVLPSGLDQIYPASHAALAHRIVEHGGTLVTEYPPETRAFPSNFVARNRLVSGLSLGVLITESAEKSGTIHTANFALEQGREVMSVPGNITSPLSVGTNNLIKSGAHPVHSAADVLQVLDLELTGMEQTIIAANGEEHTILSLIKEGVTDNTELQFKSKLSIPLFNHTVTMLEITGRIKSMGGHWVML